jgi:hypothetical protein
MKNGCIIMYSFGGVWYKILHFKTIDLCIDRNASTIDGPPSNLRLPVQPDEPEHLPLLEHIR